MKYAEDRLRAVGNEEKATAARKQIVDFKRASLKMGYVVQPVDDFQDKVKVCYR